MAILSYRWLFLPLINKGGTAIFFACKMGDPNVASLSRVPYMKPPFTVAELKKAIPAHCFKRSLLRSFSYLVLDLITAAGLFLTIQFLTKILPPALVWLVWIPYWVAQGCVFFGIWVIAHECGHRAFSNYAWVDNSVGVFLHAWLLIPFFSWRYSHNRHHRNTASVEFDEVFVPKTDKEISETMIKMMTNPFGRIFWILVTLFLGWPSYFIFNITGRKYDKFASHYYPDSPIFVNFGEKLNVAISEVAVMGAVVCLWKVGLNHGFMWLFKVYGIPLLILNGLLVLITYLHHNHPALPHYKNEEWDWLRGALSIVDRDYGMFNHVFHHIGDTHVVHHLFSSIPHYHAVQATKAVIPVLGDYYRSDNTPTVKAVWREFKECVYVAADSGAKNNGVLWFTNKLAFN